MPDKLAASQDAVSIRVRPPWRSLHRSPFGRFQYPAEIHIVFSEQTPHVTLNFLWRRVAVAFRGNVIPTLRRGR